MGRFIRILATGLLALLPLAVTAFVTYWVVTSIDDYLGPSSWPGRLLTSVGMNVSDSQAIAYVTGLLIVVVVLYILGVLVETTVGSWLYGTMDRMVHRIPLISNVYDLSKKFVSIVDLKSNDNLKTMRPVWCFFGGDQGAAVLALLPTAQPVMVGAEEYLGILVPSAPVPFGGCLIYVPKAWVKPAEGGMDHLMSVYVSMGVKPPLSVETLAAPPEITGKPAPSAPASVPPSKSAAR